MFKHTWQTINKSMVEADFHLNEASSGRCAKGQRRLHCCVGPERRTQRKCYSGVTVNDYVH